MSGISFKTVCHNPIGIFEKQQDIGNPKMSGATLYGQFNQEFKLSGGGYTIWFGRDEFYFNYKKLKGNFVLTANF